VRRQVKHLGTQTFQHYRLSRTLQQARPQYRPFYFFRINHPHNPKNMMLSDTAFHITENPIAFTDNPSC
jgi:hypothetical protein